MPRRRADAALDWLNFFTANLQTAFGPFVAVYLAQSGWRARDIGFALAVGTVGAMAGQVPAGLLVDALARKARAAGAALLAIMAGALTLALAPRMVPVLIAELSHALASCILSPAIAAISLGVAGTRPGERLGRNARFAALGNGVAAGLMAMAGWLDGTRTVFFLGAVLALPGLLALWPIGVAEPAARGGRDARAPGGSMWRLLGDRRLIWFAAACVLFHLSNAYQLPLAAAAMSDRLGPGATLVIGGCILGPQAVVACLSPAVGRAAERWGRRPVLMVGMAALPLRALALLAIARGAVLPTWMLIPAQLLDGVSAAVFGVLLPLVAADLTRGTGRFNLCLGVLGLAVGGAATLGNLGGGWLGERSVGLAFGAMAAAGAAGVAVAWLMVETRPARDAEM